MKKILILIFILNSAIYAQKVQMVIDAMKFENFDTKNITIFTENVKITRAGDVIECDKMVLYMKPKTDPNAKKEIEKIVATGNVKFTLKSNQKVYVGHGDKVTYEPQSLRYRILGNGYLEETTEKTVLQGESIYLDQKTGNANVEGSGNKPVRLIMDVETN